MQAGGGFAIAHHPGAPGVVAIAPVAIVRVSTIRDQLWPCAVAIPTGTHGHPRAPAGASGHQRGPAGTHGASGNRQQTKTGKDRPQKNPTPPASRVPTRPL